MIFGFSEMGLFYLAILLSHSILYLGWIIFIFPVWESKNIYILPLFTVLILEMTP